MKQNIGNSLMASKHNFQFYYGYVNTYVHQRVIPNVKIAHHILFVKEESIQQK